MILIWKAFQLIGLLATIIVLVYSFYKLKAKYSGAGGVWQESKIGEILQNILLWFVVLHLPLGFDLTRDWWWDHVLWTRQMWTIIISLAIAGMMMKPDEKNPMKWKVSKALGYVLAVVLIVWLWPLTSSLLKAAGYISEARPSAPTNVVTTSFTGQTHFQIEVANHWYSNLKQEEAWDMVDTIRAESHFQHYNSDGSIFRGKLNPNDLGAMQLNLQQSAKEIAEGGCSILDFECQKKVSLIIYRKHGPIRWLAYEKIKKLTVDTREIIAPVGKLSEPPTPVGKLGSNCLVLVDREITMQNQAGKKFTFSPENVPPFWALTMQFTVSDGLPGKVTIKCRENLD